MKGVISTVDKGSEFTAERLIEEKENFFYLESKDNIAKKISDVVREAIWNTLINVGDFVLLGVWGTKNLARIGHSIAIGSSINPQGQLTITHFDCNCPRSPFTDRLKAEKSLTELIRSKYPWCGVDSANRPVLSYLHIKREGTTPVAQSLMRESELIASSQAKLAMLGLFKKSAKNQPTLKTNQKHRVKKRKR